MSRQRIIFGITGASGIVYAQALLRELLALDYEIHLIVSSAAKLVMREEIDISWEDDRRGLMLFLGPNISVDRIVLYNEYDLAAGPASGTFRSKGMIVCPCSMKTVATLAAGTGSSLITRAADACLKERRRLVLVPRETPLSLIHLRAMTTVTEAGAIVLPASPGFYHKPTCIEDLVRHIALKVLDVFGVEHSISFRWKDRVAEGEC
jgi:4-hydroxy-3-polyprenylbenzoate decarboxylase